MNHHTNGNYIRKRYELFEILGSGAFGTVQRGYDRKMKKEVAIKIQGFNLFLRMKEELESRWDVWSHMDHPNLVKMYDYWLLEDDRLIYIIMEYIDGVSFDKLNFKGIGPEKMFERLQLTINPQSGTKDIWNIATDIMSGLNYMHKYNIVHRDIKPANIVRRKDSRVILVDFDFLCVASEKVKNKALTCKNTERPGTLLYESPEYVLASKMSFNKFLKNDIWGVGSTLFTYYYGTPYLLRFENINIKDLMQGIINQKKYIIKNPKNIVEKLINYLLIVDYHDRPTAREAYHVIQRTVV